MRLATIIAGYLFAAIIATCVLLAGAAALDDFSVERFGAGVRIFSFFLIYVFVLAAPIALPSILISEMLKVRNPIYFGAAGALASVVPVAFLAIDGIDAIQTIIGALLVASGAIAAVFYWWFAWKLFPPQVDDEIGKIG